jgi:hypothetical protein
MLALLGKGDKIDQVWIYADGDDQGRMIAPLAKGAYGAGVDPEQASAYADESERSKKLAPHATDATTLHLFGCHAALSKDSLGAWRNVFAGARGSVVAPEGFWQLALRSETKGITLTPDKKDGCESRTVTIAPKHRADYEASLRLIDSGVDELTTAGCLAKERAETLKKDRHAEATGHFERLLRDWFDLLQPGGELPASLRAGTPGRDAILDGMWSLWDMAGGIVFPFVAKKRVGLEATKGKKPADLAADKALGAVLPGAAGWGRKFVGRPAGTTRAADVARGAVTGVLLAAQEQEANRISRDLHVYFQQVFSDANGDLYGTKLQKPVPVKVVDDKAFEAMTLLEEQRQWDREVDVVILMEPERTKKILRREVRSSRGLTDDERENIRGRPRPDVLTKPVTAPAHYSPAEHRIYVRAGKVAVDYIAHELGHAYASDDWTAAIDAISIYGGKGDKGKDLDEGMASILSQRAIDEWFRNTNSNPTTTAPDSATGYLPRVLRYAEHFISAAESGSITPGRTVFEAYFGGGIFLERENSIVNLTVGRTNPRKFKLSDVKDAR